MVLIRRFIMHFLFFFFLIRSFSFFTNSSVRQGRQIARRHGDSWPIGLRLYRRCVKSRRMFTTRVFRIFLHNLFRSTGKLSHNIFFVSFQISHERKFEKKRYKKKNLYLISGNDPVVRRAHNYSRYVEVQN